MDEFNNINNSIIANNNSGTVTQTNIYNGDKDVINLREQGKVEIKKHISTSQLTRQKSNLKKGIFASIILPTIHLTASMIAVLQGFIWSKSVSIYIFCICFGLTVILSRDYLRINFAKVKNEGDNLKWVDKHHFLVKSKEGIDICYYKAKCIYPNCNGYIIPAYPKKKQTLNFGAWAKCSVCDTEHSYGIDKCDNAHKANVDWSEPEPPKTK